MKIPNETTLRQLKIKAGREMIDRCQQAVKRGTIKDFYPIVDEDDPEVIVSVEVLK